ncbi:hypothetical protein [Halobaculum litoreum]|uniref:Uncharacterized protein n=1 Tax=Halobaculum litoreum TaxID=3031998 RepID=A0ABD5XXP9_9EURY|nr:hypothetical protein [Halobaculum sp. DT92]
MTTTASLVTTVVTGAVLVAVAAYAVRAFPWQRLPTRAAAAPGSGAGATAALPGDTARPSWAPVALGGVAVVALGAGVGAALVPTTPVLGALLGLFAGLIALYVTWGSYHICRARGMTYAQAVGVGVWILAMVFLVGVVARLVLGG